MLVCQSLNRDRDAVRNAIRSSEDQREREFGMREVLRQQEQNKQRTSNARIRPGTSVWTVRT